MSCNHCATCGWADFMHTDKGRAKCGKLALPSSRPLCAKFEQRSGLCGNCQVRADALASMAALPPVAAHEPVEDDGA